MPFTPIINGVQHLHESDCESCMAAFGFDNAERTDWRDGWPEAEVEVAKAAGCSLEVWQSLTAEEGENRLRKACKDRAKKASEVSKTSKVDEMEL